MVWAALQCGTLSAAQSATVGARSGRGYAARHGTHRCVQVHDAAVVRRAKDRRRDGPHLCDPADRPGEHCITVPSTALRAPGAMSSGANGRIAYLATTARRRSTCLTRLTPIWTRDTAPHSAQWCVLVSRGVDRLGTESAPLCVVVSCCHFRPAASHRLTGAGEEASGEDAVHRHDVPRGARQRRRSLLARLVREQGPSPATCMAFGLKSFGFG